MTSQNWPKVDQLFDELIEIEPARRRRFLDEACAGDDDLRLELESLLSAHDEAGGFIESLPPEAVEKLLLSKDPQTIVGRPLAHYQVLSSLGAGGMGEVYLALDTKLGRNVAVKILSEHYNHSKRIDRFRQEARVVSALNHPNILTVYEIGEQEGRQFIATEYVEGETLRQLFLRAPIPLKRALDIAGQITGALAAAHSAGIVHRDIKPENIMVRPDGLVKVLDFGIAKLTPSAAFRSGAVSSIPVIKTAAGWVFGSVNYMSPEQVRGQDVDPRSDLFTVGIVLYEMLTGVRPFVGDTPSDVLAAILEREPQPLAPGVPSELARIVDKLLSKSLAARYQSAAELQGDLRSASRRFEAVSNAGPLKCPHCGGDNPGNFGYCCVCGTALHRACPRCGGETPCSSRFCGLCGYCFEDSVQTQLVSSEPKLEHFSQTIAAASTSIVRKHATIVYAVVSGCAAILEQLDPPEAERILEEIKSVVGQTIARQRGVVDRCTHDELVAFFGVPFSNEDDAFCAVQASLDLRTYLGELSDKLEGRLEHRLRVSIGVSSGPVMARLQEDKRYSVSGDALQIASRLAAQAEANEILLSPETRRLASPFFRLGERGSIPVAPGSEPVVVYFVEGESGARTRLEAAELAGLTPYTGRERELGVLQSSLHRALSGAGQVVTVFGESGVGKSRLLLEFQKLLEHESLSLLQSRCQSYGTSTAYLPFIDALRYLLGVKAESALEHARATALANIRSVDPDLEPYIPVYLHLLSIRAGDEASDISLHGDDLRFAVQEALSAVFTLRARREPTVLLLEDWHWADEGSKEALKRLAGLVPAHRLMIVVTCRPEPGLDWGPVDSQTIVQLGPLDEPSTIRIVKSLLGADDLPEGLGDLLHRRTGGNPFFIEEVCRTLIEENRIDIAGGVARLKGSLNDLQLPDTVQTVIRTRIDRLDPNLDIVLRHASVIGREFSLPLLQQMVGSAGESQRYLGALQDQGLIQQVQVVPEHVYRFKHVLTQEVVYDSLLAHQRKTLHEAAGNAIEEIYRERLEEQLELLTHHYSRAENWPKAVRYGRESAEKASRLARYSEALATLDQTEHWLSKLEGTPEWKDWLVRVLLQQERLCETLGLRDRQQQLIDRILSLAESVDDSSLLAESLVRRGELHTLLGRFEAAEKSFTRSLSISRASKDLDGERIVLRNMGFLYWRAGRLEDAVECNTTALAIDQSQNDTVGYAKDLTNLGSILRTQGRLREALSYLTEALEISETLRRPVSQVYTLAVLANLHRDLDEDPLAMRCYRRADDLAVQNHLPLHRVVILSSMASIQWKHGEVEDSLRLCNELATLTRNHGVRKELVRALETLGGHLLALSRLEEALPNLREAADLFAELGEVEEHARMLVSIAYICERGSPSAGDALEAWAAVRSIRQLLHDIPGEIEALEGMARVARGQAGRWRAALECLVHARNLADQIGDLAKRGELLNAAGIIEWTNGDYAAALESYRSALEIFRERDDVAHAGLALNSIGVTLDKLGRYDEAIVRLEEALQLHRQSGEVVLEGHALAALGDVFRQKGSHDDACRCYRASLEIRLEQGDRSGEAWMMCRIAAVLGVQGKHIEARSLLRKAFTLADELADAKLKEACQGVRLAASQED